MIIVEHHFYKFWLGIWASIFLGMTFIIAGTGKILDQLKGSELLTLLEFIPLYLIEALFIMLLVVELAIGLLLVAGVAAKFVACLSLLPIAGFIAVNILALVLGLEECLSCFGAFGGLSITQALILDGVMVALVLTTLTWYPSRFFEVRPWFWGKK